MFALRCTHKLLDGVNGSPDPEPAPPDTVLGDWYANPSAAGEAVEPMLVSVGTPAEAVIAQ